MKIAKAIICSLFVCIFSGCIGGHYVCYQIHTEPTGATISVGFQPRQGDQVILPWNGAPAAFRHKVTGADIKAAKVQLPQLIVSMPGFRPYAFTPDPIPIDHSFLKGQDNPAVEDHNPSSPFTTSLYYVHYFHNQDIIYLQREPGYAGPTLKNKISLTVNAEPQGARIYENGKFLGTTPLTLNYDINNDCYQSGEFHCAPLIAVHEGCLPDRQDLQLSIDSEWRYQNSTTHEYATLFLLKRDPDYRPPVIVQAPPVILQGQEPAQTDLNVTIKQDKDALDVLQQAGQIGIMIKSLKPVR
jgi:hypothetical protein